MKYVIGPSIGVARVGNSPKEFYLAPTRIGGRPLACDANGEQLFAQQEPVYVKRYKDEAGRIKRQAARFCLFAVDDDGSSREVTLDDKDISDIQWTVHLANKKAAWYSFSELEGNLLLGPKNSYEARKVPKRNNHVYGENRQSELIIDPGPRSLSGANQPLLEFSRFNIPSDYPHGSFPKGKPSQGLPVDTLGGIRTDSKGRLLVLGGYGHAGGDQSITSFAGADGWHDDIADGPVTCTLTLADGSHQTLRAWCIVGSPKFAPELENIVSLDDLMFDVAVRELNLLPALYNHGKYDSNYIASYQRDIEPILQRPAGYRWVAAVPVLNSFSPPPFDATDASDRTRAYRQAYFKLFRQPGENGFTGGQTNQLFDQGSALPLMPLNSGSNSVSNEVLDKFLTLTRTQYFLLSQWADGKFSLATPEPLQHVSDFDRATVGNCVGGPLCPGIEVTWSLYSRELYEAPYRIRHRHDEAYYQQHGLDPNENETDPAGSFIGCEPGDLTKRMATPWQSDFYQCTVQYVNFADNEVNKDNGIPKPPTYYAYWWPPQSPWNVMPGELSIQAQEAAGVPAGLQSIYNRGINGFAEMIQAWHYLGFITNEATGPHRELFPYFVETERNNERFRATSIGVAPASNVVSSADTNFFNAWYLAPDPDLPKVDARQAIASRGHLAR
ncbi:CTQ-dependent lysine 6-oxidase LodA [Pseudomonas donghuensis]|uniref:CTQ-dependent lysine 6-oxidase LodA n=1 Tax=Pseudomonas donghuensis TaxID=1163398 RepID=UPI002E0D5826|nr:CTQ-dependent lysine 6-oxidase LodA [Pseudomonas donghuensis]